MTIQLQTFPISQGFKDFQCYLIDLSRCSLGHGVFPELTLCYSEFDEIVAIVVVEFFAVNVPLEHRFVPL